MHYCYELYNAERHIHHEKFPQRVVANGRTFVNLQAQLSVVLGRPVAIRLVQIEVAVSNGTTQKHISLSRK